jgi:hypothetical protein
VLVFSAAKDVAGRRLKAVMRISRRIAKQSLA